MENLFLTPASQENLQRTVAQIVSFQQLLNLGLPDAVVDRVRVNSVSEIGVYCWATSSRKKGRAIFDQMEKGDYVLFKPNGVSYFRYQGKIVDKEITEVLIPLWPVGSDWKHIYFLDSMKEISIEYSKLARTFNYNNQNPRTLPGIRRVAPNRLKAAVLEPDSLFSLLSHLNSIEKQDPFESLPGGGRDGNRVPQAITRTSNSTELNSLVNELAPLTGQIEVLMQRNHSERECESLVERFFNILGYGSQEEIRFQVHSIDILLQTNDQSILAVEVKKDRAFNRSHPKAAEAIRQVFDYALRPNQAIKYVSITNGDYYGFYDTQRPGNYENKFVFEFTLSRLENADVEKINRLKRENLRS